jgi:hypothetical protein
MAGPGPVLPRGRGKRRTPIQARLSALLSWRAESFALTESGRWERPPGGINTLYRQNSHLDRDKDGVACEA